MSTRDIPETGLLTDRVEFIRETTTGQVPTDPAWEYISDNVRSVVWEPAPDATPRHGLGTPDPLSHDVGNEEHEITIEYDLQRPLVDSNGDPDDPMGDAFARNADNIIPNTHSLLIRDDRETSIPSDPSGTAGARMYVVAKGCYANAEPEFDPEEGAPVMGVVNYTAEKVRSYEILQPDSAIELAVQSTDSNDTSQDVTIEDEGGATSETVTLSGTTAVNTTATFDNVDAIELSAETTGNVELYTYDTGAGAVQDQLTTIYGAQEYSLNDQDLEGDLGVPALDAGSRASAINKSYEFYQSANLTRGGSAIDYDVNRITATVENNLEATLRQSSVRSRYNEGNRSIEVEADVIGWGSSDEYITDAMRGASANMKIEMQNSDITFNEAQPVEPGERERGPEDTAIEFSVVFSPQTDPAVSMSNTE